jgi:8-oxo-dGTP pyrophosphatase MutT (NUDIX family)
MDQPLKYDKNKAHYIVVTAILYYNRWITSKYTNDDNYYLIVKRSEKEKVFPSLWTVAGGKLETSDYLNKKKDTHECWYNIVEDALRREVKEEVGIDILGHKLKYVASMIYFRPEGIPTFCQSFAVQLDNRPEVTLCKDLTDYKWVTLEEASNYPLIDGIWRELEKFDLGLIRWRG